MGAAVRQVGLLLWLLLVGLLASSSTTQATVQELPWYRRPQRRTPQQITECPKFCVCTWSRATCSGLGIHGVYTGISNEVEALDLSNNSITELKDRELSRDGLTRLKFLNLSRNAINEIGVKAFEDIKSLAVLDLSMNRIDYLDPETFFNSKNLRSLFLAGNKFNLHVPKLHSDTITELDFSACRINTLKDDVFVQLNALRKLNLSFNQLTELSPDIIRPIRSLRSLSLGRNPWSCDTSMINLKIFLLSRKIRTDLVCDKLIVRPDDRIISLTVTSNPDLDKPALISPDPKAALDRWNWPEIEEAEQEQDEDEDDPKNSSDSSGIFSTALSNVSPFWFLVSGFLLGSGATMIFTYLWLTTTISCLIPRIRRAEGTDASDTNSQRVSLLRHLWNADGMGNAEDSGGSNGRGRTASTGTVYVPGTQIISHSCPGTPPPPYREVMLHRNLYPRAAMTAAAQQAASGRVFGAAVPAVEVMASSPTSYNI